jgi:hypothetical protein
MAFGRSRASRHRIAGQRIVLLYDHRFNISSNIVRFKINVDHVRRVQVSAGNKLESTVRYLGIEVDDAPTIAEQIDL